MFAPLPEIWLGEGFGCPAAEVFFDVRPGLSHRNIRPPGELRSRPPGARRIPATNAGALEARRFCTCERIKHLSAPCGRKPPCARGAEPLIRRLNLHG
jgi:hypothetical protein